MTEWLHVKALIFHYRTEPFDHLTTVSSLGCSCETGKVLLAGVPGVCSRDSPVFAPLTDWPISCELK